MCRGEVSSSYRPSHRKALRMLIQYNVLNIACRDLTFPSCCSNVCRLLWRSKALRFSPPKRSEKYESYNQESASGDKTHPPTDRKGNSGGERSHDGGSSPRPFDKGYSRSPPRPHQQRRRSSWPVIDRSHQRSSSVVEAQVIGCVFVSGSSPRPTRVPCC